MFEGLKKLFEKKKIDEEANVEQTATVNETEENSAPSSTSADFVAEEGAKKQENAEKVEPFKEKTDEAEVNLHDDSVILLGGKSRFTETETVENREEEEAKKEKTAEEVKEEPSTEENYSYEQADKPIREDIADEPAQEDTFGEAKEETAEETETIKTEEEQKAQTAEEEKAEREQKFGLDLEDSAKLFGMSKESLETEFKMYKADKFAARVALSVCDPYVSAEETANRVKKAVSQKLNFVTVLPNRLGVALAAANKGIKVNVAVCFPYGSDSFETRKYAVKKAARTAADGIEIPFDPTAERGRKNKILIKEYAKLVKAAKKKPLTVIIEASSYTDRELSEIINSLAEAGVKAVKSSSGTRKVVADAYSEENVAKAAKGKLSYIACFNSLTAEMLVKSFSYGAELVASPTALDAVKELRILLAGKDYAAVDVAKK
ncbi:MAG TPA: hypothetical protein DDY77_02275 [Clostridiales bacterium]|nr:hypothetical protein [Clostridiales bacterium]